MSARLPPASDAQPRQSRRHNSRSALVLPAQLTSFVGRELEVAEVKRLLGTTRLLTLTGAGGVGKTRLALEVVTGLVDRYQDGVWLIELAPLRDPILLPPTIAAALGVSEQSGRPVLDTLREWLAARSLLLVLDNCEHLVESCAALVEALLRGSPTLRILATSRETLGITGETAWRVPSLALPRPVPGAAAADLAETEAVRLFVERARAVDPGFDSSDRNVLASAHICRRLDGVPLAIELAAARVKLLSVEQIAARLDDRFRLLTGGSRTALPRQQTLRATIDWSYALLSDEERALLRRLSVFADGSTLEAAEAVCGDDVLDLLGHLVDKSLVLVDRDVGEAARYRLLETVRQYAQEKLVESGEAVTTRDRHLEWFLNFAELAEPKLRGPEQVALLDRLQTEHDNLRAALAWSRTEGSNSEIRLRLAGALHRFWWRRGHVSEGRAWLTQALDQATGPSSRARASALIGAGVLARIQGDYVVARSLCEESLAIFQALDDKGGIAHALRNRARLLLFLGEVEQAGPPIDESVRLWRELGDAWGLATALGIAGKMHQHRDDYERALTLCEESLALYRQIGDIWGISARLVDLGTLATNKGEHGRAARLLAEGLDLQRQLGDRGGVGATLLFLASLAGEQGEHDRAVAFCREALVLFRDTGELGGISATLDVLGTIAAAARLADRAARLYGAAESLHRDPGRFLVPTAWSEAHRDLNAVRAVLGEGAFEAAWVEGQSMSMDQATEYAASLSFTDAASRPVANISAETSTDPLSRREHEVVTLIARGLTNRQIADELVISERTASTHVTNILGKLGFATRAQVAAWAVEHRLAGHG